MPKFASRAAPLTHLTRKSGPVKVRWEEQHEKAFSNLKEALCNGPVLQSLEFTQPLTVQTDASGLVWGQYYSTALDTFRYYPLGKDFVPETDHRALKWLGKMKDTNVHITRWFLALQPFRFEVRYRVRKQNMVADFLSCHPTGESPEEEGSMKTVKNPFPPTRLTFPATFKRTDTRAHMCLHAHTLGYICL